MPFGHRVAQLNERLFLTRMDTPPDRPVRTVWYKVKPGTTKRESTSSHVSVKTNMSGNLSLLNKVNRLSKLEFMLLIF